jgi:Domain of unknown function (DUF1902)
MVTKDLIVKVMHDPSCNKFISWCDELPGLTACCDTVEELMEVVEDNLPWVLESLAEVAAKQVIVPQYHLAKFTEQRAV